MFDSSDNNGFPAQMELEDHMELPNPKLRITINDVLFALRYGLKVVKPIFPYGLGIGWIQRVRKRKS